jgi:hypothetical protein
MQLLKSDSSHKRTSKFGDFELIPDDGWEISGAFVDHGSQLLVVDVRCTDKSKWSHDGSATFIPARQYLIDVKIPKLLSGENLDNYFSYGPIETYSADGRYKLITTRRRGGDNIMEKIVEELIDIGSGEIVSASESLAFTEARRENLLECIAREKSEDDRRQRELESKLTLDQFIERELPKLKDGTLILNYHNKKNTFRLIFSGGRFELLIGGRLPHNYENWPKIKYRSHMRFNCLDDFWNYLTRDEKWFQNYSSFHGAADDEFISEIISAYILKSTNLVRTAKDFTYDEYERIHCWDGGSDIYHELKPSEYRQVCSNCRAIIDYQPRYPKYICQKCRKLITDANGRKLTFHNAYFMGYGCQGYYADAEPEETYDSNICYINGIEYFAVEGHFGGIVIQKYENKGRRLKADGSRRTAKYQASDIINIFIAH